MLAHMDSETAYNLALDYLYSFVDYSREKTARLARAEFKLERMFALLRPLGDPHTAYPCLHVGGTKGKGSTAALSAWALSAAGYRTGLYISPHLQDFAERMQIDGRPIDHGELARLVEEMKPVIAGIADLTVFEITTALAFLYFARQGVQAAVIEVGLGGRLDATNVITPRVAVITSLSYDHMAVLGDTLTQIAGEKAGIIKPGVPLVSSPQVEEALLVLEATAQARRAPLTLVGREVLYEGGARSLEGQDLVLRDRREHGQAAEAIHLRIPLLGRHQVENAATAWAAVQVSGLDVPPTAVRAGFANVAWPCRFEIARREPPVIFDSAHNQDSFLRLCQTLEDHFPGRGVVLIMGASEDKNLAGMLAEIQPRLRLLIATRADHPRAMPPEQVAEAAQRSGIRAETAPSVQAALSRALEVSAAGGEIVLSAGSMFATAEVKTAWQESAGGRVQ
jgi:dihydrofolate synthase/folylpolyglutamate synthase